MLQQNQSVQTAQLQLRNVPDLQKQNTSRTRTHTHTHTHTHTLTHTHTHAHMYCTYVHITA